MIVDFSEERGTELQTQQISAGEGGLFSLAFSNDGLYLVCFGGSQGVNWKTHDAQKIAEFDYTRPDLPIFSPNGAFLAACDNGGIEIWKHVGGRLISHYLTPDDRDNSFAGNVVKLFFGADEEHLHLLMDNCLRIWNIAEKREVVNYKLPAVERGIDAIETNGGLLLYSVRYVDNHPNSISITDIIRQTRFAEIALDSDSMIPIVSPCGSFVVIPIGGWNRRHVVWITAQNRICELAETDILASRRHRLITNDTFIVGGNNVRVWNLQTLSLVNNIDFISQLPPTLIYSAAGGLLAATINSIKTGYGSTRILDPWKGSILGRTFGHTGEMVCFSACGRWLASVVDHNFLVDHPNSSMPSRPPPLT